MLIIAEVATQPVAKASITKLDSNLPKPQPPYSVPV